MVLVFLEAEAQRVKCRDKVVRGRIDAIFRDDDGGWDLIDWKTGRVPSKEQLAVRGVQLAV